MNEHKAKAFILRVVQTQEADVIVKMMTQEGEKISAYARSALKSRKRFEGGLSPLSQIEFRISKKATQDLFILEESRVTYEFQKLSESVESFAAASYIAEITDACAQEGLENKKLYNLFGAALKALDSGAQTWAIAPQFEVKLLMIMGWLPDFDKVHPQQQEIFKNLLNQKINENILKLEEASKIDGVLKNYLKQHLGEGRMKSLDFFTSVRRFQEKQMVAHPKNNTD